MSTVYYCPESSRRLGTCVENFPDEDDEGLNKEYITYQLKIDIDRKLIAKLIDIDNQLKNLEMVKSILSRKLNDSSMSEKIKDYISLTTEKSNIRQRIFEVVSAKFKKQNKLNNVKNGYVKIVCKKELNFSLLTAKEGISPLIIHWVHIYNDKYIMEIERFPYILNEVDGSKYIDEIKTLVMRLHKFSIFHGDLYGKNIVVNPETNIVKLIDFGISSWFSELKDSKVFYSDRYGGKVDTIEELLEREVNKVEFLVC